MELYDQVRDLIDYRKQCRLCMVSHPGSIRNGSEFPHDPPVISHWSQWLGDLQPKLLIVGQDFGNVAYFERNQGIDDPNNATNSKLYSLLREAGLNPTPPPLQDTASGVFLTNSVLCFKSAKGMSAPVKAAWSRTCTETHLLPLINLLKPKVLVALGGPSWKSIRRLFHLQSAPQQITKAAGQHWSTESMEVFAVGHCGPLGLVNRSSQLQAQDWQRIGQFLAKETATD